MSVVKYKNPNYSEGGSEPKYITIPNIVAGGGSDLDYSILTESEYSALGEAVNTDNVLYFVTPD